MGEQVAARSNGDVAQLGEHLPCKQGVDSSNLFISTSCAEEEEAQQGPERRSHRQTATGKWAHSSGG